MKQAKLAAAVLLLFALLFSTGCSAVNSAPASSQESFSASSSLSLDGEPPGQPYEWEQVSLTQSDAVEYDVPGLYQGREVVFPFGVRGDMTACFSCVPNENAYDTSCVESVFLYSVSQDALLQEIELGHRYLDCAIADHSESTDLLLFLQNDDLEYYLAWYRWDYSENLLKQVMEFPCPQEEFANWTLLKFADEPKLVFYDAEQNKLFCLSSQNERTEIADLKGEELADLRLSSNGTELLLLEAFGEKARVCVYKNGERYRFRELAPNEDIYSVHLLQNGVLLNLQSQVQQHFEYRLVWWPFEGEESSLPVNALYRGVSNETDSVAFMEFAQQNAVLHRVTIQDGRCLMESLPLSADFSTLPQMLLMDDASGKACSQACSLFVADSQKMLFVS